MTFRTALPLCLLSALSAFPLHANAQVGLRALVSGCADQYMDICQQVGNIALEGTDDSQDAPGSLEARGTAFRARAEGLGLMRGDPPPLLEGYQAVVRDYFDNPIVNPEQRAEFFLEAELPTCAQHYTDTWFYEREWWPSNRDGNPEWKILYLHMLDHYFGWCVPTRGEGEDVRQVKPKVTRIAPAPAAAEAGTEAPAP